MPGSRDLIDGLLESAPAAAPRIHKARSNDVGACSFCTRGRSMLKTHEVTVVHGATGLIVRFCRSCAKLFQIHG